MQSRSHILYSFIFLICLPAAIALPSTAWSGHLSDGAGKAVSGAVISLHSAAAGHDYTTTTRADGKFAFPDLPPDRYELSVSTADKQWKTESPLLLEKANAATASLQLTSSGQVQVMAEAAASGQGAAQASGGEHLSSAEVSSLPLNARDFSKLLLLAAGTMTDANGAANFTQQFAVNGQRGAATVFAMDGFDTTDPEMGGATFSNFNVDAIQEVQGQFRRDAGRDWARRGELYECGDESRESTRFMEACLNFCAMRRSMRAIISITKIRPGGGAFLRLCATSLDLPMAGRSCYRESTTAAIGRFISANTRAFARCWERRR